MRRAILGTPLVLLAALFGVSASRPDQNQKDDAAIKKVVERFFAAYTKKDLDGFMALWSEKAPGLAGQKQTMQRLFKETERIELKKLTLVSVKRQGSTARVHVQA